MILQTGTEVSSNYLNKKQCRGEREDCQAAKNSSWFNGAPDYTEESYSSMIISTNDSSPGMKPDSYSIGDTGCEEDMIIDRKKTTTAASVGKLRANEAAFIRRSDGSWTYAIVKDRSFDGGSSHSIRFQVNVRGCTKDFPESQWGTHVRCIKQRGASISNTRPHASIVENEPTSSLMSKSTTRPRTLNEHNIANNKLILTFLANTVYA
jgi:hypothetical protein